MPSSRERLTRIFQPMARGIETDEVISQQQTIRYAFGQDNHLRADALPQFAEPLMLDWFDASTVATGLLLPSYFLPASYQLRAVYAHANTAPTGQPIIADIETHDNEQVARVTIAASDNYGATTGLTSDLASGIWLRLDVQQVGSGTAGSDMTVIAVLYPIGLSTGAG